jgi:hypothetical protein
MVPLVVDDVVTHFFIFTENRKSRH